MSHHTNVTQIVQEPRTPESIQLFKEDSKKHFLLSTFLSITLIIGSFLLLKFKYPLNKFVLPALLLIGVVALYFDSYIRKGIVFENEDVNTLFKYLSDPTSFFKHAIWFSMGIIVGYLTSHTKQGKIIYPIILSTLGLAFVVVHRHAEQLPNYTDSFGTHEGLIFHLLFFGLAFLIGSLI